MRTICFCFSVLACSLLVALSAAAQQSGTVVIDTKPADALVRIMNISPPYEEGMSLEPGVYDVEVSKEGFVTEREDVTVKAGTENRFTFELAEALPEGTLVVTTKPADALVRVMNITPPYEEGMSLKKGEYELDISKPGYKTINETVTLKADQENRFAYTLESNTPEPVETPAVRGNTTAESASSAPEASAEAQHQSGANATAGTLTVVTEPENATVRIMNIKPPYEPGIVLEPGAYELEISHPGYVTQSQDYEVQAGTEHTVTITLASKGETASAEEEPAATESAEQAAAPEGPAMTASFVEQFDNNDRSWYETTSSQVEIAVRDGHYHIAHKDDAQGWIAWNKTGFDPEKDFAIKATFKKIDGVLDYGYGIIWGVTNKGAAYHSFRISGNGLYSYRHEDNGTAATVIDWTPTKAIVPGLGATNTIEIRRKGDTLEFWVNGAKVDSTDYVQPDGSMVGFKVDNHQTVDVESLEVGSPQ